MALQIPRARERSAGARKVMVRMVSVAGESTAAPRPCRARAPTSMNWFWATAHTRLAPGEEEEAEHEDPPPAEEVGGASAEEQEASEGQGVGVDDPLQARGA